MSKNFLLVVLGETFILDYKHAKKFSFFNYRFQGTFSLLLTMKTYKKSIHIVIKKINENH